MQVPRRGILGSFKNDRFALCIESYTGTETLQLNQPSRGNVDLNRALKVRLSGDDSGVNELTALPPKPLPVSESARFDGYEDGVGGLAPNAQSYSSA